MTYSYDEATLDLLRLTIPTYGILVPIIQQSGTNEVIDGRHRLKVREELEAEGTPIMLPVHHVDTNNPDEIDQIVNSVRRPWQDAEQRKELVSKLREKGHSHQRIADAVGTGKATVQRDLKAKSAGDPNEPPADTKPKASKGKDNKKYVPPAKPEEIAKAWGMKDAGMSVPAIAKDLSRGETTVRKWFKKERPEAVQQGQPPIDDQPVTPTGKLNEHMKILVKREGKSSKQRIDLANRLGEVKEIVQKTMEAASKDHRRGPGVVRGNVQAAERQLAKDGQPGIQESLERVRKEARDIWKYADESLRLLQLQDSFTELK